LKGAGKVYSVTMRTNQVNALPESAYAIVNHRIAMESSVKEVEDHLIDLLTPLTKNIHATFIAFNKKIFTPSESDNPRNTTITLSTGPDNLGPAPVSPEDSYAWVVLANTVKNVFGEDVVLAPSLMTGNTDTKFYWELTRDIWRFTPIKESGRGNAHTVDEFVGVDDHVIGMGFYVNLIRGADSGR
jgi:Gly-Xaa carboxypeptidase